MYKLAIKLLLSQKERLLALFIEQLGKQYSSQRGIIADKVMSYLPKSWKETATPDEVQNLLDTITRCVHDLYQAVRPLTQR